MLVACLVVVQHHAYLGGRAPDGGALHDRLDHCAWMLLGQGPAHPLGGDLLGFTGQRSSAGCAVHVVRQQTAKQADWPSGSMSSGILTDGQAIKGFNLLPDGQQRIHLQ